MTIRAEIYKKGKQKNIRENQQTKSYFLEKTFSQDDQREKIQTTGIKR